MCRLGLFYIFNQAPSVNLQKIIQRHIIGKNWRFFLKWALNIGFLPPGTSMLCMLKQYMPAQCPAMSCMAMPCKPRHASHVMQAMSCMPMQCIECFMKELTATCQLSL
jgi:hypothetical protein